MIASIDFTSFGSKLLSLRESLGYTRSDVEQLTGLNRDTIYRVEKGLTVPRYETLEILSICYHEDLILHLSDYRPSSQFLRFEKMLETLIYNANTATLKVIDDEFYQLKKFLSINQAYYFNTAIEQYEFFILGVKMYNEKKYNICYSHLCTALKKTNSNFSIKHWNYSKYSVFELRILLLLAISLSYLQQVELSNSIIIFCLDTIANISDNKLNILKFTVTCFYNLSYNYHNIGNNNDALKFAQAGIEFCTNNDIMFCLPHLFFRKGIALYLLNNTDYLQHLKHGINLFKMAEQNHLADLFIEITFNQYGISLE